MPETLFLRLEGPLQAWGERARWSVRDSASEPTKSGIIGLVACAFGYRDDARIRSLSAKTRLGVRVDAPGTLITDYHTIGGGYEEPMLLTAQGKPKKTPGGAPHTELSYRDYLCGASFLAALQVRDLADAALIAQMAAALQAPVWPLYLGRKACVPSRPIFAGTGVFPDLETALTQHASFTTYHRPANRDAASQPFPLRLVLESDTPTGVRRRDNVYSRRYRVFHPRYTTTPQNPTYFVAVQEADGHVSLQVAA